MHWLLTLGFGNYPLLPDDGPDISKAPLPTVAVRRCSSTQLLEFANEDKRIREDVLIDILVAHFSPPAGQAPDLLFLPTSCGWADPALQDANNFTHNVTLAVGPAKCAATPGQTTANDSWCAGSCTASPAVCPPELCTCMATRSFQVTGGAAPAPRLGHFAMCASPWGAFPQAKPLMRPLLEQQWPKKMAIISTEVPAFAASWDGKAAKPTLRHNLVWGENHPPAAGMAVPFISSDLPAKVPGLSDRHTLAAFVGTVFINAKHGNTVGRSPLRELLVNECKWPGNQDACELVTDLDNTVSMSRREVYGKNSDAMDRVSLLAENAYQKARFAFCPWGDVLSRKSTSDALMQGSIPVFFEGVMADQYAHFGPIKNMSVQIPLSVLQRGGGGALKFLRAIPAEKVQWLHYNVVRLRRQFHMPDSVDGYSQGDAVDNIVRKLAAHFRSVTNNALLAGQPGSHNTYERTLPEIPIHPQYVQDLRSHQTSGWALLNASECPAGQRNAAASECLGAVQEAAQHAGDWVETRGRMKNVNGGPAQGVPPGCSYSLGSKMAIFNVNPHGRGGEVYQHVCTAEPKALLQPTSADTSAAQLSNAEMRTRVDKGVS